jgi:hypothetical protein
MTTGIAMENHGTWPWKQKVNIIKLNTIYQWRIVANSSITRRESPDKNEDPLAPSMPWRNFPLSQPARGRTWWADLEGLVLFMVTP